MIKIILTLLILIGCERNDMATMAINNELSVISTNVADNTQLYNSLNSYEEGELVRVEDSIYSIHNERTSEIGSIFSACPIGVWVGVKNNVRVVEWDGVSTTASLTCCLTQESKLVEYAFNEDISLSTSEYNYFNVSWERFSVDTFNGCTKVASVDMGTYVVKLYSDYSLVPVGGYYLLDGWLIKKLKFVDTTLDYIRQTNYLLPFDVKNTSCAKANDIMTYTASSAKHFNSFTLAGVKAEHLNYIVKDTNGNVIKEGDIEVDAWLDDGHLLEQGTVTLLVGLDTIAEAGSTIEITLTNDGEVWLGFFSSSISVDSGVTTFSIQNGGEDYNDYTPDAWGNIPEAVKAKTRIFSIVVLAKYSEYDKINRLLLSMLGKFITIDGTDSNIVRDSNTLDSLTARGIITSVQADTVVKDGDLQDYIEYNLSFLEIV